ncbi:MAG TPA: hypothetical protein VHB79_14560 [Polyangiaceae bacterium]|nr:hypothetical protein [Polyangiaceae bacterium]
MTRGWRGGALWGTGLTSLLLATPALGASKEQPGTDAKTPSSDVAALRDEVRELRAELRRAVGEPEASPERARLEVELTAARKSLAALDAAVEAGLDPSALAASEARLKARIDELERALTAQRAAEAKAPHTLYEVSNALDHTLAPRPESKPQPAPPAGWVAEAGQALQSAKASLLPLEFTAFGDLHYRFERPANDDFHIGSAELDASLSLTSFVNVSTAIPYDGESNGFGLAAFVIDCGIAGEGERFPLQTKLVKKSGVTFGRFDVPFGIAYLEYPSVENRLLTQPEAVLATHGAWNDTGAQFYAVGEHWTTLGYLVNGLEHPLNAEETAPARTAAGGRVSGKVDDLFEVGASAAWDFADEGPVMFFGGGDLSLSLGPLDVRGEYLLRHVDAPDVAELTHGAYSRALLHLDPAFLVARYDTVLQGSTTVDRRISAGAGVEIFPQGEVRAVYEQSLDSDLRTVTLQLVGGSSFQPTGLRR